MSVRDRLHEGVTRERLRMEVRRARGPAIVYAGFIAFALIAMTVLLTFSTLTPPWVTPAEYRFALDQANGVKPGLHDVRISGMHVGVINDVDLEGGKAIVKVAVDEEFGPIYNDAEVSLRPRSPLWDLYIDVVDRGTPGAGELDHVLPASQSRTPVDLGSVLNAFDGDTAARLEDLIDGLGKGLEDNGEHLAASFAELAPFLNAADRFTEELGRRGKLTRSLVHDLRLLTETLGERDSQLTELVRGASSTLGELSQNSGAFDQTLAELPPTLAQMRTSFAILRSALDEVDPALVALRPVAGTLPSSLAALESIGDSAARAVKALRDPVRRLEPLARHLDPTAASLDSAASALLPQVPRIDRLTAQIPPCALVLETFFTQTASLLKFNDAYGIIPRGDAAEGSEALLGAVPDPISEVGPSCTEEAVR